MFKGRLFKGKLFSGILLHSLIIIVFVGNEYSIYQIDIISTIQLNDTGNVSRQILSNVIDGVPGTQMLVTNPITQQSIIIW